MKVAVVGAGFSGAVIARELAKSGHEVEVFERRNHLAGNCHTFRGSSGIMEHKYGPHIFHTPSKIVWDYVSTFSEMEPYVHRVKASTAQGVFSLPINLLTLNQFFGKAMSPSQARQFLNELTTDSDMTPGNFEEQALKSVGREIYEAFLKGYTEKQWGRDPRDLPASVLKRLPVRFSYDDNYFDHRYQGIPRNGYTELVARILDHRLINLRIEEDVARAAVVDYDHTVWTGSLDSFFNFQLGRLAYRTLRFERIEEMGDFQGCSQMNYCQPDTPWTRITEHKHFATWESHEATVAYKEFSYEAQGLDEPYYPVRLADDETLLKEYISLAESTPGVTFVGRLGTYRYLDMDVTIAEALRASSVLLGTLEDKYQKPPTFVAEL